MDVHLDDNILNVISEEWTSILTACDSTDDNETYFLLKHTGEDIGKRHDAYVNTLEDSKNLQVTSTSATRHDPEAYPEVVCTHEDIAEVSICFDENFLSVIIRYSMELHRELTKNDGLDHGKVKEYWMYRGPRIIALWATGIIVIGILNEYFDSQTTSQKLADLLRSLVLLFTALYMLYWRLPDSINTAYCRTAHDYYVQMKRSLGNESQHEVV